MSRTSLAELRPTKTMIVNGHHRIGISVKLAFQLDYDVFFFDHSSDLFLQLRFVDIECPTR